MKNVALLLAFLCMGLSVSFAGDKASPPKIQGPLFSWLHTSFVRYQAGFQESMEAGTSRMNKDGMVLSKDDEHLFSAVRDHGWRSANGILGRYGGTVFHDGTKAELLDLAVHFPLYGTPEKVVAQLGGYADDLVVRILRSKEVKKRLGGREIRGFSVGLEQLSYFTHPDECHVYVVSIQCGPVGRPGFQDGSKIETIEYYVPTTAFPRKVDFGQKFFPASEPERVAQEAFEDFDHLTEDGLRFVLCGPGNFAVKPLSK